MRLRGILAWRLDASMGTRCLGGEIIDSLLVDGFDAARATMKTSKGCDHRLHHPGVSLFTITMMACIVHVILGGKRLGSSCSTAPPAFRAGFYAIANQGEFARSSDRSQAMTKSLLSSKRKICRRRFPQSTIALQRCARWR